MGIVRKSIENFQPQAPAHEEWMTCQGSGDHPCFQIVALKGFIPRPNLQDRGEVDVVRQHVDEVQGRCHTWQSLTARPGVYEHVEQINGLPCDQFRNNLAIATGVEWHYSEVFGK